MNPNFLIFSAGMLLLVLFAWYFVTESERIKRILGTIITVCIIALAVHAAYPPFDVRDAEGNIVKTGKIQLGLDLKGGTSFLIRLVAEPDEKGVKKEITKTMVEQAVEVIRKRVDTMGTSEPIITPSGTDRILVQIPGLSKEKLDSDVRAIQENLKETTTRVLASLTPREERVLRMRFGIGMNTDHTLEEVGQQFSVTRERIRQIEAKALRKLKHPSRSRKLRSFLDQ